MGRAAGAQLNILVLDASVVGAWYLQTQATPRAAAFYTAQPTPTWRAPYCFFHEVLNLMLRYERQGSLHPGSAEIVETDLRQSLKVSSGPAPSRRMTALALRLARMHQISIFDAFYLLLALELRAPLVTRDGGLAAAAANEGCAVFDVRVSA